MGDKVLLNVAATMSRSLANGPGIRAVIWVQGCTIGCAGCYNAFTHPHQQQTLVEPETIADWVASLGDIEGVSFSGGEPFEQSQAVYDAIIAIKEINPKLTFFCYSGYDFTELKSSNEPSVSNLLSELDMLSAGPYIHAQRSQDLLWRGSKNQKLHYLSRAYSKKQEKEWKESSPTEEFILNNDDIHFSGFEGPGSPFLRSFNRVIRAKTVWEGFKQGV